MNESDTAERMYAPLLTLSREACATGLYATAFHALAAALHCAEAAANLAQLAEVETVAREQLDWIDTHAPTHLLATASATARDNTNLWESLANQARALQQVAAAKVHWHAPS